MTVGLDTMTMIWGLQGIEPRGGNPQQMNLTEMQQRAVILLDILEEQKEKIVVPSVMVAELLVKVDLADHSNYLAELQRRFFIPLFDLPASALAATLWVKHKSLPKAEQMGRTTVKSDVMIVATIKIAGASNSTVTIGNVGN